MQRWLTETTEQGKLRAIQLLGRGLAARPEAYGVPPAAAAEALRLADDLAAAIAVASDPATRTPLAVAAKRHALDAATKHCRPLVSFVRLNPAVDDADLAAIGVPPKTEARRVPPPTTVPLLSLRGIVPGGHEIELFDSAAPDRRGKPDDAKGLELFVAYSPNHGDAAALSADAIVKVGKPHGLLTRGLSTVTHPNDRVGSVANYVGRWVNRRGESGPFSRPIRMLLAIPGDAALRDAA